MPFIFILKGGRQEDPLHLPPSEKAWMTFRGIYIIFTNYAKNQYFHD